MLMTFLASLKPVLAIVPWKIVAPLVLLPALAYLFVRRTDLVIKFVLPLAAAAGVVFSVIRVYATSRPEPAAKIHQEPISRPAKASEIAGAGLIEAKMENIPIGAPTAGVVVKVEVKVGDRVRAGDPLFRLDDRPLRAERAVRQAELEAARAELHRLASAPRAEDVPLARAALAEAKARLDDAEAAVGRSQRLYERQMVAASEYDRDRYAYLAAKATAERAAADLKRLLAGTWKEDLDVARAKVQQARAAVERVEIELDRLVVRALSDGEVLQVNVRPGQFAATAWREPMVVLGDVDQLNVRVDVDEHDLPRFRPDMQAVAYLRGQPDVPFPLRKLVKVEPYVIPKQNLTGDTYERVDTRVLQVVYALPDERPFPLYVGQQMDVYFNPPEHASGRPPARPGGSQPLGRGRRVPEGAGSPKPR